MNPNESYIVIATGESYSTEIVPGKYVAETMARLQFDQPTEEEIAEIQKDLSNPDNWYHIDGNAAHYGCDVGETDRIDVYLIKK